MKAGKELTKKDDDERFSKNFRQEEDFPLPFDNFRDREADAFKISLTTSGFFGGLLSSIM